MGSNDILWGTSSTVDHLVTIEELQLYRVLRGWMKEDILPEFKDKFTEICDDGLHTDVELEIKAPHGDPGSLLEAALNSLKAKELSPEASVGGSPAISAIRGHMLSRNVETDLPRVSYVGLYPASVRELASGDPVLQEVFRGSIEVGFKPGTLSLETERCKLMISNRQGRNLDDLCENENWGDSDYLRALRRMIAQARGTVVLAMGGLSGSTPSKFESLIDTLKDEFGENVHIFVGTNSFSRKKTEEIEEYFEKVLEKADIVSFNDAELGQVYNAVAGPNEEISLAAKLRGLELDAIKVCHAAEGAILDLGRSPGEIIKSTKFNEDPNGFLEEMLRLSVHGTTMALDRYRGRDTTEQDVAIFSKNVRSRQNNGFVYRFAHPSLSGVAPNGMIYNEAPQLDKARGKVTGLGAIFDSLLLSFMLRE